MVYMHLDYVFKWVYMKIIDVLASSSSQRETIIKHIANG